MKLHRWVFAFAATMILGACGSDSTGADGTTTVTANATSFSPSSVTIQTGETVRWRNNSGTLHNVTPSNAAQAGVFAASNLANGGTFNFTFNTAGTFNYTCTLHAGMNGSVVVQP